MNNVIKKIVLYNLESHVHTEIDFTNGINAMIGSSDSGKSTTLRSMLSYIFFKPLIIRFAEPWGGFEIHTEKGILSRYREDTVKFKCSSCNKIYKCELDLCPDCNSDTRLPHRTKKHDVYSIYGNSIQEIINVINSSCIARDERTCDTCFEKMSKGFNNLSKEIIDSLPFVMLDLGKNEPVTLNVKQQFEHFIWDELSNCEFSRLLSYLEGNDYVNDMLKYIKDDISRDRNLLNVIKPDIIDLKDKVESSGNIVKRYETDMKELISKKDKFTDLYENYSNLFTKLHNFDEIIAQGLEINDKIEKLHYKPYKRISSLLDIFSALSMHICEYEAIRANLEVEINLVNKFDGRNVDSIEHLLILFKKLENVINAEEEVNKIYMSNNIKFKNAEIQFNDSKKIFTELITNKNICPYSGFSLNSNCKTIILDKLT